MIASKRQGRKIRVIPLDCEDDYRVSKDTNMAMDHDDYDAVPAAGSVKGKCTSVE